MSKSNFDIGHAKSLVEQILENLAALPEDGAKYAQLRAAVEDMRFMSFPLLFVVQAGGTMPLV